MILPSIQGQEHKPTPATAEDIASRCIKCPRRSVNDSTYQTPREPALLTAATRACVLSGYVYSGSIYMFVKLVSLTGLLHTACVRRARDFLRHTEPFPRME